MTDELHEQTEQGNPERSQALSRLSDALASLCAPATAAKVLSSVLDLGGLTGDEAFELLRWCVVTQSGEA